VNVIKYIFDEIKGLQNKSLYLHGMVFKQVKDYIFANTR
jgi:hypothetical protein